MDRRSESRIQSFYAELLDELRIEDEELQMS